MYQLLWVMGFLLGSLRVFYPEQIHLAYTENQGEIKVLWVTWYHFSSSIWYRPILCHSAEVHSQWAGVQGTCSRFTPGSLGLWSYYIHEANMRDLDRNCIYEYTIGNGAFVSEVYRVRGRTASSANSTDQESSKFWVLGDWGYENGQDTLDLLVAHSGAGDIDGILCLGDLAYDLDSSQGAVGDNFMNMIQPVTAQTLFMVTFGNHDKDRWNNTHYKTRFRMPKNDANENTGMFYSFNLGLVHYISINSVLYEYYHASQGELLTQYNWLIKDLQEANLNRHKVPWIVLFTHMPFYCTPDWTKSNVFSEYHECLRDVVLLRRYWEDLLYNYNVDLVFQGHLHNYERDTPIYRNISYTSRYDTFNRHVDPVAPIFILTGNAGNRLYHNDPISSHFALYTRFLSEDYGIGKLTIFNSTHAYWEQYRSSDHAVTDYLWVIKRALK